MSKTEITIYTELAKENGKVKIIRHEGEEYYIAQVKSDNHVFDSRLIPITTNLGGIRQILVALAQYHQKVLETAKASVIMQI
jgi:hypothetical protein